MRNHFTIFLKILLLILSGVFVFSSCVPLKKQIYLQTNEDSSRQDTFKEQIFDHKMQVGNNLYVRIVSLDSDVSDFFNTGISASGNIYYDAAIYLNSYSVDEEGYVEMPFLGKIYIKDLTLNEVKDKIQKQVDEYLNKTMVIVKLVNYNITIVGEVNRPGQYKIYQDRINIFEILGMAGDLTPYAKRHEVVLLRKNDKGTKMHKMNLLEDNILESELYYLMPDDIVYVQPVKGKNFAYTSFPYSLVISSISLIIALMAIIK